MQAGPPLTLYHTWCPGMSRYRAVCPGTGTTGTTGCPGMSRWPGGCFQNCPGTGTPTGTRVPVSRCPGGPGSRLVDPCKLRPGLCSLKGNVQTWSWLVQRGWVKPQRFGRSSRLEGRGLLLGQPASWRVGSPGGQPAHRPAAPTRRPACQPPLFAAPLPGALMLPLSPTVLSAGPPARPPARLKACPPCQPSRPFPRPSTGGPPPRTPSPFQVLVGVD